jgi:hypothetical protein
MTPTCRRPDWNEVFEQKLRDLWSLDCDGTGDALDPYSWLTLIVPYRNSKLLHPKPRSKHKPSITMFEDTIMQIAMDEGWFDMASLVAIARCNNQLKALVDRADHSWKPILAEIKFPQAGFVDDTDWTSRDIPSRFYDLRVPPRINGGRRDNHSYFVHPRDKQARGRGLVLANLGWVHNTRFDQTNGILEDLFYAENDDYDDDISRRWIDHMSLWIYIPRALPIECKACRVMLDSYPALVAHCKHGITGRTWTKHVVDECRKSLWIHETQSPIINLRVSSKR